jgi:outer membrane protein assembly factor BamB
MNVPEPPVVANGIVFVISSGEFLRQIKDDGQFYSAQERIEKSSGAVLYALDAETGKELYSSGKTITTFTHFGGLSVTDGRIFLTTHDSKVYAFAGPEQ